MPSTKGPLVAIGSRNPAKTRGAENVFATAFPGSTFVEVDTSSVAKAQPIGIDEVIGGATRRAEFALKKAKADFGVGVEAGILISGEAHVNLQAAFIVDKGGKTGLGLSSGFLIPLSFIAKMRSEKAELDAYSHELTGAKKITEEEGIVYHLTKGRISRLQMTEQSVTMALVPWLNGKNY